jgi:hypothetical protein
VTPIANTAIADYTYISAVLYYYTIQGTSAGWITPLVLELGYRHDAQSIRARFPAATRTFLFTTVF